jgi:hypothetical protein
MYPADPSGRKRKQGAGVGFPANFFIKISPLSLFPIRENIFCFEKVR